MLLSFFIIIIAIKIIIVVFCFFCFIPIDLLVECYLANNNLRSFVRCDWILDSFSKKKGKLRKTRLATSEKNTNKTEVSILLN